MTLAPQSATRTRIPAGTYVIDPAHTRVGFVARHAMVTKVRGAFDEVEATAVVADPIEDSSVSVTISTASITTRNEQRDGHLRSGDFLDVDGHPQITFVSTAVEPVAGGDVVRITGDLTIKGTTRPVTIDFEFQGSATDPFGNDRIGFEGSVAINRKDWGVSWNAALETGGVLVSEKVVLEFEISAIRAA